MFHHEWCYTPQMLFLFHMVVFFHHSLFQVAIFIFKNKNPFCFWTCYCRWIITVDISFEFMVMPWTRDEAIQNCMQSLLLCCSIEFFCLLIRQTPSSSYGFWRLATFFLLDTWLDGWHWNMLDLKLYLYDLPTDCSLSLHLTYKEHSESQFIAL